jgi:hypothetical protein
MKEIHDNGPAGIDLLVCVRVWGFLCVWVLLWAWSGLGAFVHPSIHSSIPRSSLRVQWEACVQARGWDRGVLPFPNYSPTPELRHIIPRAVPLSISMDAGSWRSGKSWRNRIPPTNSCATASRPTAAALLRRTRLHAAPTVISVPSTRTSEYRAPQSAPNAAQARLVLHRADASLPRVLAPALSASCAFGFACCIGGFGATVDLHCQRNGRGQRALQVSRGFTGVRRCMGCRQVVRVQRP